MKNTSSETGKKGGFWAAIKESMTKTGGCCGSGGDCCDPAKQKLEKEQTKEEPAPRSCCDD